MRKYYKLDCRFYTVDADNEAKCSLAKRRCLICHSYLKSVTELSYAEHVLILERRRGVRIATWMSFAAIVISLATLLSRDKGSDTEIREAVSEVIELLRSREE